MTNECIPVEALGTLETLPPDHPMRRHAETCPRCNAMAFAYAQFVQGDTVEGANPADADRRLDAFIAQHVERGPAVPVSGAPKHGRGRWFEMPSFRFAAAAAVLVLIAAAVMRWQPWAGDEIVYRGGSATGITVEAARPANDGTIELRWAAVPGADSYQVTILAADLSEVTRLPATTEARARFDPTTAPGSAYWQVSAMREGGVIANSAPEPVVVVTDE